MKHLLIFGLFLLTTLCKAQSSFSLTDKDGLDVTNSTVNITGDANVFFPNDEPLKWQGKLTNTTQSAKPVLVKRQVINVPSGSENQFCWSVQCYAPITNQATDTVDIAGGATDASFYSYFFPGGNNGSWSIKYVFFDASNPSDSVHVTLVFNVSGGNTSIGNNFAKVGIPFGPVPANRTVTFQTSALNLDGNESLRVFDLSGKTVAQMPLKKAQKEVTLFLDALNSGVYLWNIGKGSNTLGTGRLIVQH
ncbi:MAG: T9SS type A sorting domain-containing protein [Bacteroidetes bacterium]|jgi:hypothetical protein|nr:T9SS type A sorting domain-containing protein [Bacteroidota bacterium]MDA0930371.1 T9SS type A sorting domain-containing protein [Bacteroidota bacterium]